jgi:hypothetical protein
MIDLSDKSDKQAALARRLLKSEIKRICKKLQVSPKEALELLLHSMQNGTSQYRHQVWELREELKRLLR